MYALAVGMGRKYLIEISCCNMKDNSDEDISVGFIIEPVHQKDKREDTNDEVQTIKPPLTHYISVILTFNTCKGEMPDSPVSCKKHRCFEETHSRTEAVSTITMPRKFLKCRCKNKEKPYRKDTRSECVMTCNDELWRTVTEKQRYSHSTQDTCRHQQTSCEIILPLIKRQT